MVTRMQLRFLACLFGSLVLLGCVSGPTTDGGGWLAITNVAIAGVDRARPQPGMTVLVSDGVIDQVGPVSGVALPKGTRVIDGRGAWLMPGIADMHTHVDDPVLFPLLLASGVTTTLNMGGSSADYRQRIRPAVAARCMIGPYPLAALMIDGPGDDGGSAVVPKSTEEARALVRTARTHGYDYIKVYSRLAPAMFEAIADESSKVGITMVGHVVRSVGLKRNLELGLRMVAHGEEYLTVFDDDAAPQTARIPELVRWTVASGATVTANVDGIERIAAQWGDRKPVDAWLAAPEAADLPQSIRDKWGKARYSRMSGSYGREARFVAELALALHRAGVPILVGTDTPDIAGVPPGASALNEIERLSAIGFGNRDALVAATVTAGDFVVRTVPDAQRFGRIAPGYRADLLLLSRDPVADLTALRSPIGVVTNGHWLSSAALREAVAKAASGGDISPCPAFAPRQ